MNEKPSSANWTRDADGNPVNWTLEPYLVCGALHLVLAGEDARAIPRETFKKRLREYTAIREKERRNIMAKQSTDGPYVTKPGGGIMKREPDN